MVIYPFFAAQMLAKPHPVPAYRCITCSCKPSLQVTYVLDCGSTNPEVLNSIPDGASKFSGSRRPPAIKKEAATGVQEGGINHNEEMCAAFTALAELLKAKGDGAAYIVTMLSYHLRGNSMTCLLWTWRRWHQRICSQCKQQGGRHPGSIP